MSKAEIAEKYFKEGYNCAQAVAMAFAEEMGMDINAVARLASPFGAGLGRQRLTCGAVSGGFLVFGTLYGCDDPSRKGEVYERVQELSNTFKEQFGSLVCRELLAGVQVTSGTDPEERTPTYYKKRPCVEYVRYMAQLLESQI